MVIKRRFMVLALGIWFCAFPSLGNAQDLPVDARVKALAHYMMALCHDLNGESAQAVAQYQQSARFNGQEPAPYLRLASYYVRTNQLEEALVQLKQVVQLAPKEIQAHYLMALIYSAQKKLDLAAAEYENILKQASQNDPNNIEIYSYLAQLYYAEHQYPKAVIQLKKILAIRPHHASANYLLGSLYVDMNERNKAREAFRRVLTIERQHDGALNALAYIYAQDGTHLYEALKMIHKAIAIDPTNGAYYDTLGWVLYKQELYGESLMALQKAATYIQDPLIYEHMADVYLAVKEFSLASKFLHKSLDIEPNQPLVRQKIQQLEKTQAYQSAQ